MKKQILSIGLVLMMLASTALAATRSDLRWAYFRMVNSNIYMENGKIEWVGDADTYDVDAVTRTKISVKLQVQTIGGWGTVETATDSSADYMTTAGGTYSNWSEGESYRVAVEAWCYDGNKELEHVGPFYEHLNT